MLRPLNVWETDDGGNVLLDEHGNRVPMTGKRAGQPKTEAEKNAAERAFDMKQREDEEDWKLRRAAEVVARDAQLRAAEAILAAEARDAASKVKR